MGPRLAPLGVQGIADQGSRQGCGGAQHHRAILYRIRVRVRLGEHFSYTPMPEHGITETVRNCVSFDYHIPGLRLFIVEK